MAEEKAAELEHFDSNSLTTSESEDQREERTQGQKELQRALEEFAAQPVDAWYGSQ